MKIKLSNVFIMLLLCLVPLFICFKINKHLITPFNISLLQVSSNSMRPICYEGDYIFIIKKANYNVGDIVTYKDKNNYLITHRIIGKYKNVFILKGDANGISDEEITEDKIIGKVIYIFKRREKTAYE